MSTMITEVYDAFKSAGTDDEKARAAAKAVAEHENRFGAIESQLTLLKWMVGFNLAISLAALWKLIS